jgi:hypothetical protein
MESKNKQILDLSISKEQNMFVVAERFISHLIKIHDKYRVSTDWLHGIDRNLAIF